MTSDGIEQKSSNPGLEPDVDLNDESAANVIEVSGVIKWFDVAKGYGFIIPDNGMADVLLHVTCLRRDGYQTAYEGARVVCEVLPRPKGLQAFRVISMDESTAIHPAQMPPPRTHVTVAPTSGLERAQVKWFNRLRGFGFLTRGEGTPDIFVHMETLRRFGLTELRPGQFVLVRYGPGPKGMMAAEVRPEGGGDQRCVVADDLRMQQPDPGDGRKQDQRVGRHVEASACRRCLSESARDQPVEEIGEAGCDEARPDDSPVPHQCVHPDDRHEEDSQPGDGIGDLRRSLSHKRSLACGDYG